MDKIVRDKAKTHEKTHTEGQNCIEKSSGDKRDAAAARVEARLITCGAPSTCDRPRASRRVTLPSGCLCRTRPDT
jgi:hypothetical protein